MRQRIPVHVVTGAPGAGDLITRLCSARADWVGLVGKPPSVPIHNVRAIAGGCPCCTGKVVLQVSLARVLRESRATRAFVEIADAGHAASLETALAEFPLGLSVATARRVLLPEDAEIGFKDFEGG